MMSGYAWGNASVTVGADAAADVTLTLKVRSGGLAAPARPAGTKKCAVHGVDMHAVAVRIGSGDMKPPEYTAEMASFPNAEPFEGDGKRIGVPLLGVTWGYRCPQCVQARNEHDNGGAWPLGFDGATPAGWARYTVANAVTFAAPAGLSASSTGTDCAGTSEWVGAGIRVTATYGPISYVDQFGSGDMGGDVIVDRMVVRVALWHTDGGGARLASGFWAPPTGDSRLTLVIDADGSAGLDTATGIVGSVRFVAK
jgi:hypothetical protein